MKFFRLDSSIRTEDSVSRALADLVEAEWVRAHPDAEFIRRDLGRRPLPAIWPVAEASRTTEEHARTDEQRAATAFAAELADELLACDAYLLAIPMYNFGVPQQVKHWFDVIITDPRAADVSRQILPGRPAVLVEARGGGYTPGTPRAGWDHATPYVQRMLADVWGLDVLTARAELTAADVNPAMAELRPLAHRLLAEARVEATEHARTIAERLRTAPNTRTGAALDEVRPSGSR
ncbi:FMN-dependent NADH-azoreductase [Embleya scabrispora]|uniref:FMN-dependent NADH-azoreductase n=1 Tax=Embleya scabrispora TaxID=159449 RepID=UPI0003652BB3|nr:NAD(P)H-dependent oxidoreductase [Embleya scabrispora]MYS82737.1 flavodoxin family protein [Streptomyces sp. SID5474]